MRFARILVAILAAHFSGCAMMEALTFRKAPNTGMDPGEVALVIAPGEGKVSSTTPPWSWIDDFVADAPSLKKALEPCSLSSTADFQPNNLFAAAAAEFAIAAAFGELQRRLDEIDRNSKPDPYVVRHFTTGKTLRAAKCLIVVRFADDTKHRADEASRNPGGLLLVYRVEPYKSDKPKDAVALIPAAVRAFSSVAWARSSDDGKPPLIDVTVAFALKCLVSPTNALPRMAVVGAVTSRLSDVCVAARGTQVQGCATPKGATDLLAMPRDSDVCSLTTSVVEVGHVGLDKDYAQAQLKALSEALGGAVGDWLKSRGGGE